ncbi:MAG: 16S rRNA (cytosine(967)-C(5))-methyltransferase RsmB [Terriglobales bacterium]
MAVSPARSVAFGILLRVDREDSYATELLHSAPGTNLGSRDHGLATELVMGVLRWQSLLDRQLAAASSQKIERLDGEVLTALRLGVYQLQFLTRVPARAAIFESVELVKAARKRSAAPFVNAVLRKVAKAGSEDIFDEIASSSDSAVLAQNAAHPLWLVERWVEHYGLEVTRQICAHDQTVPGSAIHIHDDQSEAELAEAGVHLAPGHLLSSARRVLSGDVTVTCSYQEGHVSIQDEASQLVALLAGGGEMILDCCAAPGGKTAFLARRNPRAKVFATELHPHRARLLRNLSHSPNVHVVAADARQMPFSPSTFDCVLADVPCSGTGTLAHNPEIKWRLRKEDLHDLQSRQIAILKSALAQLAVGGRLVYSTCSLEYEENETVVEAIVENNKEFKVVDCRVELERLRQSGEICGMDVASLLAGPHLRTIPGMHPADGFFAAMIERK